MSIVERVKNILLDPKATWPVIDAEPATVKSVFVPYVVALAAIPAVAGLIGLSTLGLVGAGVTNMVVGYVLSLAMVYVLSLAVDALAPTFGGRKDPVSALKLVAYGSTAGFVGGIFSVLPAASLLGLVASLYSIYLIYVGLPVMMKCPQEKVPAYTAVIVVCGIVIGVVMAAASAMFTPTGIPAVPR